jgi:hypothetical protein
MLSDIKAMFEAIKEILPNAFDVVLHKTHIHIEYDPKTKDEILIFKY